MSVRNILTTSLTLVVLGGLVGAGIWTRPYWEGRLFPAAAGEKPEDEPQAHGHGNDRIHLSPQARESLDLQVRPVTLGSHPRTIQVPAKVVERPGRSDRGITTPLAGVVTRIVAVPGEAVRPGQELFTVRLVSDYLQNSQTELYRTVRDLQINKDLKDRLVLVSNSIPEARIIEVDYERRRLEAKEQALRFDLAARGLTPDQVRGVSEGQFVTRITIRAPQPDAGRPDGSSPSARSAASPPRYEVEDLKVHLGEQVQAGQTLCVLARHQGLYLEGEVYKHEVPLVRRALDERWPVEAAFTEEAGEGWPSLEGRLKVRFFGNKIDPESQTLPVYVPLPNHHREYTDAGQTFRSWRFRPGQRAYLRIPVEQFTGVFVLPSGAVAREGVEHYVFRQNGKVFDRTEVRVVYRDREHVVIANDGSITRGAYLVHNGAAQLQRALQLQAAGGPDPHAGHMH